MPQRRVQGRRRSWRSTRLRSSTRADLRRAIFLFSVTLAAVLSTPARANDPVSIESHRAQGIIEVHATAELSADADTAWRVLTDYDRYADFIPDLRSSHVVERRGGTVFVEQSGDAVYGVLRLPLHVTFEVRETPPVRLESRVVRGNVRAAESAYTLRATAHGVLLEYSGLIAPGFPLPASVEQSAVESNATRRFTALVAEIERQAALERAHSVDSAR